MLWKFFSAVASTGFSRRGHSPWSRGTFKFIPSWGNLKLIFEFQVKYAKNKKKSDVSVCVYVKSLKLPFPGVSMQLKVCVAHCSCFAHY